MSLGKKQERFSRAIVILKEYARYHGYELRDGDAFRDKRMHGDLGQPNVIKALIDSGMVEKSWFDERGYASYGHINSCHKLKLAKDLNVTQDGVYLQGQTATDAHNFLHDFWDMLGGSERCEYT